MLSSEESKDGEKNQLNFFGGFSSFHTKNIKIRLQGDGTLFSLLAV